MFGVFLACKLSLFLFSGIYDQDYLDYVVQILKKCQQRAIHVYIDPHQDTVSSVSLK